HYISVPADTILGAAGAENLILVFPGKRILERWSLRTFEKETATPVPVAFAVHRVALGSSSHGPLLLWGETRNNALVDIDTFKKTLEIRNNQELSGNVSLHMLHIEAAPDGSAFTYWNRRQHGEEP